MYRVKLGELWISLEFDGIEDDTKRDLSKTGYDTSTQKALGKVFERMPSEKRLVSTIDLPDEEAARAFYAFLLRSMYADFSSLGGEPEENYRNHWRWKRGMQSLRRQLESQGVKELRPV